MASPEQAGSARPKRPAPMTRQGSSQSHLSQSPSEKGHHRPQQHKVTHRHVAGGRMQRTASTGKNLGKAGRGAQHTPHAQHAQHAPTPAAADEGGRHHRRSQSGTSLSVPSSPRPGFKRNASSGAIMRHNPGAHAHGGLRKNHSSGHLVGKAKGGKGSRDLALAKGRLGNPGRSRQASPEERPIVHFDIGQDGPDADEEEGGWTEESASQSPNTTRSTTRSNSVAAEAQRVVDDATESNTRANAGDAADTAPASLPARARAPPPHSRPPDADLITSRLLQRSASHTLVAPQPSAVSATVPSAADRLALSTSVASTLVDTPGRDLVSRFMDGDGSASTPHAGTYMPHRAAAPPVAPADTAAPAAAPSPDDAPTRPPSGASTPIFSAPNRTQNKLMLQRAASAIEPHDPLPAGLRTAGPSFHSIPLSYAEGRADPRLLQQFQHVTVEYAVVRRFRDPVREGVARVMHMPGVARMVTRPRSKGAQGDAGLDGAGAAEASELCRAMWDSAEVVGGE